MSAVQDPVVIDWLEFVAKRVEQLVSEQSAVYRDMGMSKDFIVGYAEGARGVGASFATVIAMHIKPPRA